MIPFEENAVWITLTHLDSRMPEPRIRWNLNWIPEEIGRLETENLERKRQFCLDGMEEFLFSVAMLSPDISWLMSGAEEDSVENHRQLLSRYVHWLPEIVSMQSFLTHDYLRGSQIEHDCSWAFMVFRCAHFLGFQIAPDHVHDSDLIAALSQASLIEHVEN